MTCTRCGGLFREGAGAWGGGRTVLDEADGLVLWGGYQPIDVGAYQTSSGDPAGARLTR